MNKRATNDSDVFMSSKWLQWSGDEKSRRRMATVHITADASSVAALHIDNVSIAHNGAQIDAPTGTALDGVLSVKRERISRIAALRAYPWRRLPGPKIRLWDKEFRHLHTQHGRPETLRKWLRRTTAYVWKVMRHG